MGRPSNGADIFRAISHPKRRMMLERLRRDGDLIATELFDGLKLANGTASRHLQVLMAAGLVVQKVRGHFHFYSISDAATAFIFKWAASVAASNRANQSGRRRQVTAN
ncbi:MAG: ArsR/SmtB family transcription factor [Phycisphaerales bacterium]